MKLAHRILGVAVLFAAALLPTSVPCARANGSPRATAAHSNAECVGYYTLEVPGKFEYALPEKFSDGLSSWGSEIRLDLNRLGAVDLLVSQSASTADLLALMESENVEQVRIKQEFLRKADLFEAPDLTRDELLNKAKAVATFQPIRDTAIGASYGADKFSLHALVNGHILSADVKPQGTPEQTLDAFLSHYKPRALGEVPVGPGVCLPYGFFTGEKQPATVGLNIRLKDRPDIVIFLLATDAATDAPEEPDQFIGRKSQPMTTFYASRGIAAMDRFLPGRRVTIDGQAGLGVFVNIQRDATLRQGVHNPATGDVDWGYLAYVPGLSGRPPGESFNIMLRVERFGRFAQHPMKEGEFRELVARIASSIKRRPGAWVQN